MSDGLVATPQGADHAAAPTSGEVLAGSWGAVSAAELARRTVVLEAETTVPLGDLFDLRGTPSGLIRFEGDLRRVDRIGAGLSEGTVVVESGVGHEAGIGMSGGVLDVHGDAGDRVGGAAPEARKGMTGGELIVRRERGHGAGHPHAAGSARRYPPRRGPTRGRR